jgi:CubicO group peptidase (beta-lactamase class C family)
LPAEVESRVAHLEVDPPPAEIESKLVGLAMQMGAEPAAAQEAAMSWIAMLMDPESVVRRISTLGGAFADLLNENGLANTREFRAAEVPAANMVTDARSLARMYAATLQPVDGISLLEPSTVEAMCVVQTSPAQIYGVPPGTETLVEALTAPYALGFIRPARLFPLTGPSSFGHTGAGGSLAFADRDAGVSFGYVMNRMSAETIDPRAEALVAAVSNCMAER